MPRPTWQGLPCAVVVACLGGCATPASAPAAHAEVPADPPGEDTRSSNDGLHALPASQLPPTRTRVGVLRVLLVEEELCTGAGARTITFELLRARGKQKPTPTQTRVGGHGFAGLSTLEPGDIVVELAAKLGEARAFVEVESEWAAEQALDGGPLAPSQTRHPPPREILGNCHWLRTLP